MIENLEITLEYLKKNFIWPLVGIGLSIITILTVVSTNYLVSRLLKNKPSSIKVSIKDQEGVYKEFIITGEETEAEILNKLRDDTPEKPGKPIYQRHPLSLGLMIFVLLASIWIIRQIIPPTLTPTAIQATGTAEAIAVASTLTQQATIADTPTPTNTPRPTFTSTPVAPSPTPTADTPAETPSFLPIIPSPEPTSTPTDTPTPVPPTNTSTSAHLTITDTKGVEMVLVPDGSFHMGSNDGSSPEQPMHVVALDSFYIDKYEVTNALYKSCVDAGACVPLSETKSEMRTHYYGNPEFYEYPAIYVDWFQAKNYCEWRGASLPTEAEWEKAARGTGRRTYSWGEQAPSTTLANYARNIGDTTPVKNYPDGASPYGVYNMAGNVWEWVHSAYQPYPYQADDGREDSGTVNNRVIRGGGWESIGEELLHTTRRADKPPDQSNNTIGFRCVVRFASDNILSPLAPNLQRGSQEFEIQVTNKNQDLIFDFPLTTYSWGITDNLGNSYELERSPIPELNMYDTPLSLTVAPNTSSKARIVVDSPIHPNATTITFIVRNIWSQELGSQFKQPIPPITWSQDLP